MSLIRKSAVMILFLSGAAMVISALVSGHTVPPTSPASAVTLKPCRVEDVKQELLCGTYQVFENRRTGSGRKLPLKIVVIPAQHRHPDQGPVFYMAGGPGESATELASLVAQWGDAEDHDVVLVDERGTGEGHRLDCPPRTSDENLDEYLNGPFDAVAARSCHEELSKKFDLTQYTTPNFADDIDEIRAAMGYDKINLNGGSFGTYAAQIYMRRHPEHVRTAYLTSLVTLSERVPLYHARNAQAGLDRLFLECEQDAACRSAYPKLRQDFAAIMKQLRQKAVATFVKHPVTGAKTEIHLTERAFADALRTMMYREPSTRDIPFLIKQAAAGDFSRFAEAAVRSSRNVYSGGRMGLHYCITCNEFVRRIKPDEIDEAIAGSFLGSWRVRDQMAACQEWPNTELPS